MKPYHFKIVVENPCEESWGNMTPNKKGRFCDLCSKTVVDFTQMSENEIATFMHKNRHKSICGRLPSRQTQQVIFHPSTQKEKWAFPSKIAASAMVVASLTACSGNAQTNADPIQSPMVIESVQNNTTTSNREKKNDPIPVTDSFKTIHGIITSELNLQPIVKAEVTLVTMAQRISVYTNEKGEYEINVPLDLIEDKNVLYISFNEVLPPKNITYLSEEEIANLEWGERQNYEMITQPIYNEIIEILDFSKSNQFDFVAKIDYLAYEMVLGGMRSYPVDYKRVYLIDGIEIKEEDYYKIVSNQSCSFEDKSIIFLTGEAAQEVYGDAIDELIIIDSQPTVL